MNTLSLVSTDDDILDRRAALEDEHRVGLSGFGLALAFAGGTLTVEALHSSVKGA